MFSADLFSNPLGVTSRRFLERAFLAPEVQAVEIEGDRSRAEISFRSTATGGREVIRKISGFFKRDDVPVNGSSPLVFPPILPESETNVVRVYRHGHVLSTWKVKHETPGGFVSITRVAPKARTLPGDRTRVDERCRRLTATKRTN